MNFIGLRTLKTVIGAVFATIFATVLGVNYAVSAGIIAILSLENTKKKSIKVAVKRIKATIIALTISSILFMILGFNTYIFGLFLLIFIPITSRLKISEGIVVASVLVSHILVDKQVNFSIILNEIFLMGIGAGVALLLNIYMPTFEKELIKGKDDVEILMKEIIINMAESLKNQSVSITEQQLYDCLEEKLKSLKKIAYINMENCLFSDVEYYVNYIEMRTMQFEAMKNMRKHFRRMFKTFHQTNLVADFIEGIGNDIGKDLPMEKFFQRLEILRRDFETQELPKTREEFENRALLYQFLNDIEQLLDIKRKFHKRLEISSYLK